LRSRVLETHKHSERRHSSRLSTWKRPLNFRWRIKIWLKLLKLKLMENDAWMEFCSNKLVVL
jgi:hypothetical protein